MPAGHPIQPRFHPEELKALDEWRRGQPNPPTRSAALKTLAFIAMHGAAHVEDKERRAPKK
jgi:hypothetical protein